MPSLTIDVVAQFASLQDGIRKVEKQTSGMVSSVDRAFTGLQRAFIALGGAAVLGTVANSIGDVADELDQLSKAAQGAGVTVEALSALRFAAELSGVQAQELDKALGALSKRLSDAARGSGEAAEAFNSLDLDPAQFKSADEALFALADKFARLPDGVQKSALAATIFGEDLGARLVPLLNAGAEGLRAMTEEADRLGAVVSTQAAEAAVRFNDELTRMQTELSAVSRELSGPVITAIADFFELVRRTRESEGGLFRGYSEGLIASGEDLENSIEKRRRVLAKLREDLAALNEAPADQSGLGIVDFFRNQEREAAKLRDTIESVDASLGRLLRRQSQELTSQANLVDPFNPPPEAGVPMGGGTDTGAAKRASEGERLIRTLERQRDAMRELTATEQLSLDILNDRVNLTETEERRARTIAQQIDAIRQRNELEQQSLEIQRLAEQGEERERARTEAARAALERDAERFADLADPVRVLFREVDRVQEALSAGLITEQVAQANTERILNSRDALGEVAEAAQAVQDNSAQVELSFTSAFESAVFGAESAGDAFRGLLVDMGKLLLRAQLLEPLFNFVKGGGLGGIFGASSTGGSLGALGPTVGQADAFTGLFLNSAQAATGNTYNVTVPAGVSALQTEQAVARGVKASQSQILDSRARNGVFGP